MRKGDLAKQNFIQKLQETFGEDYVVTQDKKTYIWMDDIDGKVQLAVSTTMVKEPITVDSPKASAFKKKDSSSEEEIPTLEISKEDKAKVEELMRTLGIQP